MSILCHSQQKLTNNKIDRERSRMENVSNYKRLERKSTAYVCVLKKIYIQFICMMNELIDENSEDSPLPMVDSLLSDP